MSDANDFAAGVKALLSSDATFVAAIAALLGAPVVNVVIGNIPVAEIPAGMFPCWVIEQGDGNATPTTESHEYQTIGLGETSYASELYAALVWIDPDPVNAGTTRGKLPTPMAQLFMRQPQPGGIDGATFAGWQPDRGANHPVQVWRAVIAGNYTITKT